MNANSEISSNQRKQEKQLSNDEKRRLSPKVPYLLQYVGNPNYYDRIKVGGKMICESLSTDVEPHSN
jgi:hypothetical protein